MVRKEELRREEQDQAVKAALTVLSGYGAMLPRMEQALARLDRSLGQQD